MANCLPGGIPQHDNCGWGSPGLFDVMYCEIQIFCWKEIAPTLPFSGFDIVFFGPENLTHTHMFGERAIWWHWIPPTPLVFFVIFHGYNDHEHQTAMFSYL